jgi:multidrug efflux system outer membrane protein
MPKSFSLLLAFGILLCGCTMIPQYRQPTAPVATQFPAAAATNESHVADMAWKDFIADERLRKITGLALTNNRDLRVAVLNVAQSRAQYRISRASLYPEIDATGNYTRAQTSTAGLGPIGGGSSTFTYSQWSASIGTSAYEVDLFGRMRSLNREALEKYFATAEAQRAATITLVAEVATQYFALRQAEEQVKLAQQTLRVVLESYQLNKATFDAGAINELDLRTAEGQVETARLNLVDYERQRAQAENMLVLLVGTSLPSDLPQPSAFGANNLLAEVSPGLPSELTLRRADILEAEHTLKAANADVGAARAAFFPRITLTTSVGTTSSQLSQLFGAGTGVWSFAPQVTLPIFTGGRLRGDLDASKISKSIEMVQYEKAIQTAFREVADALVATGSYAKEIETEASLAQTQQRRYELANARYRLGEDSYLNVLSAQQDLYSAQQGMLQARYNQLAGKIALYKALGGGWK